MEKAYRHISYFFWALLVITFTGFFTTYIAKFPTFTGTVPAHHIHGFLLLLWLATLIAQPLLIKARKVEWHRRVGRVAYVLVPLMVVSILMVTRVAYLRGLGQQTIEQQSYAMYMSFVDLVPFITLYVLAMRYRRVPAVHMRYIIACSVIFFNPAFGRINAIHLGMDLISAVVVSYVYCDAMLLSFLIYDIVKKRAYKTYLYSLLFLLICHSSLLYVPFSRVWQSASQTFAQAFF